MARHSRDGAIVDVFYASQLFLGFGGESLIAFVQAASTHWFDGIERESLAMCVMLSVRRSISSASEFTVLEAEATKFRVDAANWSVVVFCLALLRSFGLHLILEKIVIVSNYSGQIVDTAKQDARHLARARMADFGVLFWLENVFTFFSVSILYTSTTFFPNFLVAERGMSRQLAGQCASLIYWCVGVALFAGALADRIGHHRTIQIVATTTVLLGFLLLYAAPSFDPWILVDLVEISLAFLEQNSYTLLARTFPSEDIEATRFGIM